MSKDTDFESPAHDWQAGWMDNAIRFEVNLPVSRHADALELWWDMTASSELVEA